MSATGELFPEVIGCRPKFPAGPIVRDAYVEGNYRWWLSRAWGPGPSIGIIGLNPSNADHQRDDPTMLREIGFAYRWGYGSLLKMNLYPFISANPAAMRKWLQAGRNGDHAAHIALFDNLNLCAEKLWVCDRIWAAWGNGADADDLNSLECVMTDDKRRYFDLWCIGRNADGSPKHTLARGVHRVPDEAELQVWQRWGA